MLAALLRYLGRTARFLIISIAVIFMIRFFGVDVSRAIGQSMEPYLQSNQVFLVNKFLYLIQPPHRYDVVQLFDPNNAQQLVVKRIIGLPGETIVIKQNAVFLRGENGVDTKIEEPYLSADSITRMSVEREGLMVIPENLYFVLGDNRLYSIDSRSYGAVHRILIGGRVFVW